jgi:hypothetical protein
MITGPPPKFHAIRDILATASQMTSWVRGHWHIEVRRDVALCE